MKLISLNAGPLRMLFDPQSAFLRYVRLDDAEIVRGIYVAVRDQAWNTIPFEVFDLEIGARDDHFALAWMARCVSDEIAFEWRGNITGSKRGTITYQFDGQATASFSRNRIGICLLHPIRECAGQPCVVTHSDGTTTEGAFPKWISPHQPFKNIRSIRHVVRPDVDAKITFDGDVFEMEDQRNWTDASFKTYSTPLERPYPMRLEPGDRVKQSATIELQPIEAASPIAVPARTNCSNQLNASNDCVRISVDWSASRALPAIGLSLAHFARPKLNGGVVSRLKEIPLDHLRVDLRLVSNGWQDHLQDALQLVDQLGVPLEVAIVCDSTWDPAWRECLEQLAEDRHRIARWLVLPANSKSTPTELVLESYQELLAIDPAISIAFGTDGNFADLNRNRPTIPEKALVCYSLHPQMHAHDNLSLCETLEVQYTTVDSTFEYFQRHVVISPITLRPRFNSTAAMLAARGAYVEPPADDRQSTGFAAAWTVGSLSQLAAQRHLASVTYYETHGSRGIMDLEGKPYAVHALFSAMLGYQQICSASSSCPLTVMGAALLREDGGRGMILGNMSSDPQLVEIETSDGRAFRDTLSPEAIKHYPNC